MKRAPIICLALSLLGCEAPQVFPGADKRQNLQSGRIEGHVVISSTGRGKVVLFLFDAARPPPPSGTGRPLTFTVVSRDSIFGSAMDGDTGPFVAPFAFAFVAPGRYLIRGFIDADDDFNPWYGVTADATQGDVGGAAVDPVKGDPRIVEVGIGATGLPIPALSINVSFSDAAKLPVDRPVFSVVGDLESITLSAQPKVIELQATPIVEGVMMQAAPAFLARFVDDDKDGRPDDANGDGAPDLWPRVVVRKLAQGQSPLVDENDLDRNGVVDSEGEDYERINGQKDGKPDVVVLGAGFDVSEQTASLLDTMGRVKRSPTPLSRLKLVLQPRAFDASTPDAPQPLRAAPFGRYAITIIQETGQTWRVPNELGLSVPGLPQVSSQSFVVQVQ